jgi:hypothetical protein
MNAADVTQHSPDVAKSALAAENPIFGTWKLQSLVYEVSATGQRSSPFGDHPEGTRLSSRNVLAPQWAIIPLLQHFRLKADSESACHKLRVRAASKILVHYSNTSD